MEQGSYVHTLCVCACPGKERVVERIDSNAKRGRNGGRARVDNERVDLRMFQQAGAPLFIAASQ